MATIRQAINNVQHLYSKGTPSDDTRLRPRLIYHTLLRKRAHLLENRINKNQKLSQWEYSVMNCLPIEQVEASVCKCVPSLGCKFYRSTEQVPALLASMDGHVMQFVTTIDGMMHFDEYSWDTMEYKKGAKYTSEVPSFFILDGYLYLTHVPDPKFPLEYVKVSILAEDPSEVKSSHCDEDAGCESVLDKEFPLHGKMYDAAVELAAQELLNIFLKTEDDKTGDSQDSPG